ncbi:MAG: DNA-binding protein [Segetibacter sp.]|nr:DNA-binding protein [Segetibacter sp.]
MFHRNKIRDMEQQIITTFTPDAFFQSIRAIIKEEIKTEQQADLQEKFLSPKDTCKLFQPNISKVTLSAWTKDGLLKDYRISGRVYYKYSEIMEAVKHLARYKRPVATN